MDAGVVDPDSTLLAVAAKSGLEASVKYLLQRKEGVSCKRSYVNFRDTSGQTRLLGCIGINASSPLLPGSRGSLLTPERIRCRKLGSRMGRARL